MLPEVTDHNRCMFSLRLTKNERLQLKLLSIHSGRGMDELSREALADLQVKYVGTVPPDAS